MVSDGLIDRFEYLCIMKHGDERRPLVCLGLLGLFDFRQRGMLRRHDFQMLKVKSRFLGRARRLVLQDGLEPRYPLSQIIRIVAVRMLVSLIDARRTTGRARDALRRVSRLEAAPDFPSPA